MIKKDTTRGRARQQNKEVSLKTSLCSNKYSNPHTGHWSQLQHNRHLKGIAKEIKRQDKTVIRGNFLIDKRKMRGIIQNSGLHGKFFILDCASLAQNVTTYGRLSIIHFTHYFISFAHTKKEKKQGDIDGRAFASQQGRRIASQPGLGGVCTFFTCTCGFSLIFSCRSKSCMLGYLVILNCPLGGWVSPRVPETVLSRVSLILAQWLLDLSISWKGKLGKEN